MFPHQQMAVPMMPQADLVLSPWCRVCTGTCHDTQVGCGGTWGCGYTYACGDSRVYLTQVAAQVQDPLIALRELQQSLELTLAGVKAQERLLHDRQSAARTEAGPIPEK